MRIEVVHARPHGHDCVALTLEQGATVQDAVRAAGLDMDFAGLAIYGEKVEPGTPLRDGDRVELLRRLAADPMEARRRRAGPPRGRRRG